MAFNNYNYTFQVLYQSSVLHSLAGTLAFKNAEKLMEVSFVKMGILNFDDSYLVHNHTKKINLIKSVFQLANLNITS